MASIIKTDNIQKVSDDSNIIKKCGSTITIGSCGASVALASGATQTGFGRTGTVDWCTTAKTSPFTSVNGKGYFVNTTSGAVTVTLPASPSAGDIIAVKDYARTFSCNAVTICRNGSKMCGACSNSDFTTKGLSATLIYVDGTKGWQLINDDATTQIGASFIQASGGTETTCGNFKIHTFTGSADFVVSSVGNEAGGGDKVSYMVVAGGAGTGDTGAGGAGGFREGKNTPFDSYTASPLAAACSGLTVTAATFPITVGAGGAKQANGSNSIFSSITSAGGGTGGENPATPNNKGAAGGSGGGGMQGASTSAPIRPAVGGAGNTPPVSPPQGNAGGNGSPGDNTGGGGGGGATSVGGNVSPSSPGTNGVGGTGGTGAGTAINPASGVGTPGPNGSLRYYAGGGGGSHYGPPSYNGPNTPTPGGYGGGGNGGVWTVAPTPTLTGATSGTTNTGGGAGGVVGPSSTSGGSGIVIIRYKFQ